MGVFLFLLMEQNFILIHFQDNYCEKNKKMNGDLAHRPEYGHAKPTLYRTPDMTKQKKTKSFLKFKMCGHNSMMLQICIF